jgi:hypothetical protein
MNYSKIRVEQIHREKIYFRVSNAGVLLKKL